MSEVNHQKLATNWKLPPSRANAKITGPLESAEGVQKGLFQLGLTSADLKPIDWRKKVNLSKILNQQNCGDCWAMSSTSALCDRFIIWQGLDSLELVPALTAQCTRETLDKGCEGGQPFAAGKFFEEFGVPSVSKACPAWEKFCSPSACALPTCSQMKQECEPDKLPLFKGKSTRNLTALNSDGSIDPSMTIINMKKELLDGPFVCCFFVPRDFMVSAIYKWEKTKGVYINGAYNEELDKMNLPADLLKNLGNPTGKQWQDIMMEGGSPSAHAVSVVGWNKTNIPGYGKVPYWIVRNSWGPDWMQDGYFKIAMNDGSGHNALLGFDVPVNSIVIASTGQSVNMDGVFGGGTTFVPDIAKSPIPDGRDGSRSKRDAPEKGSDNGSDDTSSSKSKTVKIVIIVSAVVLGAILIGVLWKKYGSFGKKKK